MLDLKLKPCPFCGESYVYIRTLKTRNDILCNPHIYCPDCGQALDWSDEE